MMKNTIVHIDIDAFYASVEELDNPSLRGKAVVVSGRDLRSIVTTANYEARKYGIHSAMPLFMAKNLCPNLVVAPMRRSRYLEMSREVMSIISKYSKVVEKVSIDECYIDISNSGMDELTLVKELREEIKLCTGLTVSVGLSYNKFLAKLGSDWNKPNGLKVISREDVPDILLPLDIKKVHGLGKKSQDKLRNIGINTIDDLMGLSKEFLYDMFKKMGPEIYDRIRGIDKRVVETTRIRKSLGIERTFEDTRNREVLEKYIKNYVDELCFDLEKHNLGFSTLTLKMKTFDFVITTHSKTYPYVLKEYDDIYNKSMLLFAENYKGEKLRLMGITASNLVDLDKLQLSIYDL